jgi:two-component system chemotaxis sensor kinase CheA
MHDLLNGSLTEKNEDPSLLDVQLVELALDPSDPDLLSHIFGLMRSIKGTCDFPGMPRLEAVAHGGASILGAVRESEFEVSASAGATRSAAVPNLEQ